MKTKTHHEMSPSLKGLSPGLHPHDSMRTLGHQMLPMPGSFSTESDNDYSAKASDFHIKAGFPQRQAPPGKMKLMSGKNSGIVPAYAGDAARRKALGY